MGSKGLMALGPFLEAEVAAAAVAALPASPPLPASPRSTVMQPMAPMEGGPTQTCMSETRAPGILLSMTPVEPKVAGPPTWGTGPVVMGQTCMSPKVEAGILPIITLGFPTVTVPPWAVRSPMRSAGFPMIPS
jgi:hypothetical protein